MSGNISQLVIKLALTMINMSLGVLNQPSVISRSGSVLAGCLPKHVSKSHTIRTQFDNMPQVTTSLKHCSTFAIRRR